MQIDVGSDDHDHFIDPEERMRIAMARRSRRARGAARPLAGEQAGGPSAQVCCGKPRLMPPWLGSSQRDVIAFSCV